MFNVDEHDFKIKIHNGWLVATESADKEDYPGMLIYYSKDGKTFSLDDLIAVVEQNAEDDKIQIDLYNKCREDYSYVFDYKDGELRE
jgi:hypothetical protein